MNQLYPYMGSKQRHLNLVNDLIDDSSSKNYCEPFLGSGAIFLNLKKNFSCHYLNDLQEENTLAFKYAHLLDDDYIKEIFLDCLSKYPLTKEDYYLFRDELLNKTENSSIEKSIYIMRAYSQCINGMVRFNKSKFK